MEELSAGLSSDGEVGPPEGWEPEEEPVELEGEAGGGAMGLVTEGLSMVGFMGSALEGTGGWEVEIEVIVPVKTGGLASGGFKGSWLWMAGWLTGAEGRGAMDGEAGLGVTGGADWLSPGMFPGRAELAGG